MKKTFATIFVLPIFISACSASSLTAAHQSTPAVTQVPATLPATKIPSTQPFTPTPTLALPVSQFTPVPSSNTRITAENVQDLQEVAKYYGKVNYIAKLTNDKKYLFILDPDGLTKYDYASMESMVHLPMANSVSDMQISDDGGLLILDNEWFLDLKNDQDPKLHVLAEKIHLLNFYSRDFALSPDGKIIAVAQNNCNDLCKHTFRLVSTEDFSELFTSSAQTLQDLPTFSSDGKYFALADLAQITTSGGGTEPAGGIVSVWTTNDFTRVSSMSVKFPFRISSIAFSEDNNLLAIAQRTSIDIYDIASGETKATIDNLCDSYERKVMFAPTAPLKVLESSDCGSGEWTFSGSTARLVSDNVPDLSVILFDEKGIFKEIPYVYPTTPNLRAYRDQYYLKFLNNDILSFKNFDLETLDRHSCDLSLTDGSPDCQSHAPQYYWAGSQLVLSEYKDVILATDGKYYSYVVGTEKVDIFSFDNPSQVYYSIAFRDYTFDLIALDPINKIVVYNIALSMSINRVVILDMTNDQILEKWEGATSIDSIVFSENNKFVGICRGIGYTSGPNKDRLVIFDLSEKRIAYNMDFTCGAAALDTTADGSKLAVEHNYLRNPNDEFYSARTMILNTTPPYEKIFVDFDSWFYPYAAVFSPGDSMLAVGCADNEICFLDPSDGREIYRMKAHSGISNLAFSPDGSLLAASSNWGLISLWAVPPFSSDVRQPQSSPISAYTPGFSWNFDEAGNLEGWDNWGELDNVDVQNGYLSAKAIGADPQIYSSEGLGIDATKYSRIEIRMQVSAGDLAQLFFRNDNNDLSEDKSKILPIEAGTDFKTYILDMSEIPGWKSIIYQLRLDPTSDINGATIKIDYIRLLP